MIFCRTRRTVVRSFEEKDLETVYEWIRSPQILAPGAPARYSMEQYREMFARDGFQKGVRKRYVIELETGAIVGEVSHFDFFQGAAVPAVYEIGILIGEMSARGKGIATEVQCALVDTLFTATDANRIQAFTHVENPAEQRALEKCDMTREGRLRQMVRVDDTFRDWFAYSILRREWEKSPAYLPTAPWRKQAE